MHIHIARINALQAHLALRPNDPNILSELLLELGLAHIEQLPERSCSDTLDLAQIIMGATVLYHRLDAMEQRARLLNKITDEWCSDEVSCLYFCMCRDREDAEALQAVMVHAEAKPSTGVDARYHELVALIGSINACLTTIDAVLRPHMAILAHYLNPTKVSQLVLEKLKWLNRREPVSPPSFLQLRDFASRTQEREGEGASHRWSSLGCCVSIRSIQPIRS